MAVIVGSKVITKEVPDATTYGTAMEDIESNPIKIPKVICICILKF